MAFNYEDIIKEKNENIKRLEAMLYDAILGWYDNSLTEYEGLDDEEFVDAVCTNTGLTKAEYKALIDGTTEDCSWNA